MRKKLTKRVVCMLAVAAVLAISAVTVFATDPTASESGITAVTTAMGTALADFSATNILSIITAALAIAIPLMFVWFAFRFIYGKAKKALRGRGA